MMDNSPTQPKRRKWKKGRSYNGMTAKELLKNKHLAVFRVIRTVGGPIKGGVTVPASIPTYVTDTIAIAPLAEPKLGYIIAGAIESPIEPRFTKKRGADIATGRVITTMNGYNVSKAPQSVMVVHEDLTPEILRVFLQLLGKYDFDSERGFPYVTLKHKGTKGRTIDESLNFIVHVAKKLRPIVESA